MIVGALRVVTSKQRRARRAVAGAGAGRRRGAVPARRRRVRRRHQVLVYVGAVMVLFLFGVMLTRAQHRRGERPQQQARAGRHPGGAADARRDVVGAHRRLRRRQAARRADHGVRSRTGQISDNIFGPYLLPFWALVASCSRRRHRRHRPGPEGLSRCSINQFLLLGAVLFCIGVYGVIARKNAVMVLMSVELILNSVNINLLAFALLHGNDRRQHRSPCTSSPSPPPRSASAWRWCCSSTATGAPSRSTNSPR